MLRTLKKEVENINTRFNYCETKTICRQYSTNAAFKEESFTECKTGWQRLVSMPNKICANNSNKLICLTIFDSTVYNCKTQYLPGRRTSGVHIDSKVNSSGWLYYFNKSHYMLLEVGKSHSYIAVKFTKNKWHLIFSNIFNKTGILTLEAF